MDRLRKLLWPFAPLYAAIVWLRNKCYDWGIFSSEAFAVPVLCVGNLSVGGTGKTPMVEWLLRFFQGQKRVAVLSRGYGRGSRGYIKASPESTVADVGDEPLQLSRNFPDSIIAVDADRRAGIRRLISEEHPDLIILDDGFQHRRVRPSHSILLTAWDALYPDQGYLPSGDLRDHKSQAGRADLVIVTKCPENPSEADRRAISKKLALGPSQLLAFATLDYSDVEDQNGKPVDPKEFRNTPFNLVTGIARPGPLVAKLQGEGFEFEHLRFPDHHSFRDEDLRRLKTIPRLLTTEKDAVRLREDLDSFWCIRVAHQFGPEDLGVVEGFLRQF